MEKGNLLNRQPTSYVTDKFGVCTYTATRWAKKNDVLLIGRMYWWSASDIKRFSERETEPGNPNWKPKKKTGGKKV